VESVMGSNEFGTPGPSGEIEGDNVGLGSGLAE
jgi:hypothetical protein